MQATLNSDISRNNSSSHTITTDLEASRCPLLLNRIHSL